MKRAVWFRGEPPSRDDAMLYAVCPCQPAPPSGEWVAMTEDALAWCLGFREIGPLGPRRFMLAHVVPHRVKFPGSDWSWYKQLPRRRQIADGARLFTYSPADGRVARSNRSGAQVSPRHLPVVVDCRACGESVLIDWNDVAP